MIRKRIAIFMSLVFLFTAFSCVSAQERDMDTTSEYTKEDINKIQFSISSITEAGTKKFFCSYPVDEAFFGWLVDKYGAQSLYSIAYEVRTKGPKVEYWRKYTGNTMHSLWSTYCRDMNYASYQWDNTKWVDKKNSNIELCFVGDINFDDNWYTMKQAKRVKGVGNCFSSEILGKLMYADVTMMNNEFTFGKEGKAIEGKEYTFRASEKNVDYYKMFGTDIVSLANNHVYDYGEEGLKKTINVLDEAGLNYLGAGDNIDEASDTVYYIIDGRKIAIVSATEIERYSNYTKAATETEAGVFKMRDTGLVCKKIKEAKKQADYVIAYVHWGREGNDYFEREQENVAYKLVDAGADIIIGGHPHRLQGASYVNGVPVLYSLGNFWFSDGTLYTTIANVSIDDEGKLSVKMLPCLQKNLKVTLLTEATDRDGFYTYLMNTSKNVGFGENGTLYDTKKKHGKVKYDAGDSFSFNTTTVDLEGQQIDIVGNRK